MKNLKILTLVCGIAMAYIPFAYSKTSSVVAVSFTGVVPEVRCDSTKDRVPSFSVLDKNNDGLLTEQELGEIENHSFWDIDFDHNGYVSPIELNVYKKRNCLI